MTRPLWQGHADGRHTFGAWAIRPIAPGRWALTGGNGIPFGEFDSLQAIDAFVCEADAEAASDAEAARWAK